MNYCKRCLYPSNAKPGIILDDETGICSGCQYHESREKQNWADRADKLRMLLESEKKKARDRNQPYDCIIPVSGGKDSHYQVHLIKNVYGLNPLLVTFNHGFNTQLGIKNLNNLVAKLGCDLVRVTANLNSTKKIAKYMLQQCGDITWHYHCGIRTTPFQVAVEKQIPLIIWGEHGFAELTGMVALEEGVEFTQWTRLEHDMRGHTAESLVGHNGILESDIQPYIYPTEKEIKECGIRDLGLSDEEKEKAEKGVRGIYLSNFIDWNGKKQAEEMIDLYGFNVFEGKRDRTFLLYGKTDDHANDVHDYLKYLKFGYGRATDDASMEIRHGRMTREEGVKLVAEYDSNRPQTLDTYLDFLDISEEEFESYIDNMRDTDIWKSYIRDGKKYWQVVDNVNCHLADPGTEEARVKQVEDRTFSEENKDLYWNEKTWNDYKGEGLEKEFTVL